MDAIDRTDNCPRCHVGNKPVCWEPTLTNIAGGRFTYECQCGNEWVTNWAGDLTDHTKSQDTEVDWAEVGADILAGIESRRTKFIEDHTVNGVLDINAGEGP